MIKARVYVALRPSIFDPQSKAIENALHELNYKNIKELRASKCFDFTFAETDHEAVKKQIDEICDKLLVNPNTEYYKYELVEVNA